MAAVLLASCGGSPAPPHPAAHEAAAANDIAWFQGSVDEAFAAAKASRKPVFLYWGAEWCPPCHEVKATVFRSREFIERSRLFIPVYVDGDSDNAQALGERFGVVGYPSMLVFSPDGEEVTRIPGGSDVQAYATVLDLTLASLRPVATTLVEVLDHGSVLGADDCALLAHYSWGSSPELLSGRDPAAVFAALAQACPAEAEVNRSILRMQALQASIDAATPMTDAGNRAAALQLVNSVLDDGRKVRASLDSVLFSSARLVAGVTEPRSAERVALRDRFNTVLERLRNDQSLFMTERLYAVLGKIRLARLDAADEPVPKALQVEAVAMVRMADEQTPDPFVRQTVINAAGHLLDEAGLVEQARSLLLAELDKSKQPYYFMLSLGEIEQQAGRFPEAIEWLQRAYDASRGPATRFQWGTSYVTGLVEMAPDETGRIRDAALAVVRELEQSKDFHQRSRTRLDRLSATLQAWGTTPQRREALAWIRRNVMQVCEQIPDQDPARTTCAGFLAGA